MSKKTELFNKKKTKAAKCSQPSSTPSNTGYQWSTQAYTLSEIMARFKLPCVVKCNVANCGLSWENFSFDMRQPLLLYSLRTVRKVYARTLQRDPLSEEYVAYGPAIVIPQDYPGWFSLADGDTKRARVHTAPDSLVKDKVSVFLNTTNVAALQMQSSPGGAVQFLQRTLHPGELLRVGKIYIGGVTEQKKWKLSIGKRPKEKEKEVKYLLCNDDKDCEVLIPLDKPVRFYEISVENNNNSSNSSVIQMTKILQNAKFPVLAQMIYGELPALMCSFTGSLHLLGAFEEQTIVAATLGEEVNMMFEIGVASSIRYNLALNESYIQNIDPYRRAVSMCESDVASYVANMKLAFTLKPELEELDDLNYDFYDMDSIPSYRDDSLSLRSTTSENVQSKEHFKGDALPTPPDMKSFQYDTVSI